MGVQNTRNPLLVLVRILLFIIVPAVLGAQIVTVVDASTKIRPGDSLPVRTTAEIHAAQNEFEAFQVAVIGPATGISVAISPLVGPSGAIIPSSEVRLYRESYLNVTVPSNIEGATGRWPDGLIPDVDEVANEKRNAFPFDVPTGENRVVWVEVHVPQSQLPGSYTGTLTVSGAGFASAQIPLKLLVWNFALPSTSSLASNFGMGWDAACLAHYGSYAACGGNGGVERTHLLYARFLLDHRISSDMVYYGPGGCSGLNCDWSHFDQVYGAYFDGSDTNLRLHGAKPTTIHYEWGQTAEQYQGWAQHFRQKGWFSRTFDYTDDEPASNANWSLIAPRAAMVHAADPQFRTLVTANFADATANGVANSINILSPVVNDVENKPNSWSPDLGNTRPSYAPFLAANPINQIWWYNSCMSDGCNIVGDTYFTGWPSYMVDVNAVQNRAQGMMSWAYQMSGLLYWSVDSMLSTAWINQYTFGGNGDGNLLYPGTPAMIGGSTDVPVASIRLKMIREGFEDYEYLKILADLGDPAFATQAVQALFPHTYSANQPAASLYATRETIAHRILALKGSVSPNQPPSSCTYAVSSSATSLSASGGTGTLSITAPAGCTWTAASTATWLTFTEGASGSGSDVATYSVAANSGASRTGVFTVAGQTITITQAGATAVPVVASLTPPAGNSGALTAVFTSPSGYPALEVLNVLINTGLDSRQACYLAYSRSTNVLYLVADNGDPTQVTGKLMNGSGTLANSQCTVNLAGSSSVGNGNNLSLTLDLTFPPSFGGQKIIYAAARDTAGGNSGWQMMGIQQAPGFRAVYPNSSSVSPSAGMSLSQVFSFSFQDAVSANNLQTVWMLIKDGLDSRNACYIAYYRPNNSVYLYPDNGDGTQAASMALSGTSTVANSQCAISAQGASVQLAGNMLTVSLPITFQTAFSGKKGIWTAAQTLGGGHTSVWQIMGIWQVAASQ